MTAPVQVDLPVAAAPVPDPRRWAALSIIAVAQLMVVLDATIVNIALPAAQSSLHISDANRQWVVTAYTLTFGGLLLLGGRIADYWGRKRAFVAGIIGFAFASALGGLAQNDAMLFAARALQGAFGALLAPASLALLTVMFTEPKERAKAFGVYGGIAGGGAAVGLVMGGVLTEYANWRWCLLVNIPIALVTAVFALRLVRESRAGGNTRYDIPGAIVVTAGLVSLVYGFTKAATDSWRAAPTIAFISAGIALLALFVLIELRSRNPLLPMRILAHRTRGGAYLSSLLAGAGFIGAMLFVTFYFQNVLGYTPLKAGLATLPLTVGVLFAAGTASAILPRFGARPLMAMGSLVAAVGMLAMTRIGVTSAFASTALPAELILGFGLGFIFVPLGTAALVDVGNHDAGAASAVVNSTQQVGGSLGTALLSTIAVTATTGYLSSHGTGGAPSPTLAAQAAVHGFRIGFAWGAMFLFLAAIVVFTLVRAPRDSMTKTSPTEADTTEAARGHR